MIPEVPVRQWVLSLPYRVRTLCAYDAEACAVVRGVLVRAVSFVQRFDSGLRLIVHFHLLWLDGAYGWEPVVKGPLCAELGGFLSLQGTSTPVLGTTWQLQTTELPVTMALGFTVIGLSDPALHDLTVIGMPGCGLRASLDIFTAFTVAAGTPFYDWGIGIPANAPRGVQVYATTIVAPNPAPNAFGLITSNGIRGLVNGSQNQFLANVTGADLPLCRRGPFASGRQIAVDDAFVSQGVGRATAP